MKKLHISMWLLLAIFCLSIYSPAISLSHHADSCQPNDHHIAMSATYVGATTTGKFHYLGCRWAKRISDNHRVYFDSREDAIDSGYVPCKVCRP